MDSRFRIFILILVAFLTLVFGTHEANAFWIWTPETNKWVNPKYSVKETPREQLDHAMSYFTGDNYRAAIAEYKKLIKHYPRSREASEAQFYIAMAQEMQGHILKAFHSYQLALEKYPFSERTQDVLKRQYNIGILMLDGKSGRNKIVKMVVGGDYDVIEIFRTIIKNAPYGEYAASSQYKIGLYLQEKLLYQEARDEFEKTVNDYPETEWAKAAQYQISENRNRSHNMKIICNDSHNPQPSS